MMSNRAFVGIGVPQASGDLREFQHRAACAAPLELPGRVRGTASKIVSGMAQDIR